MLDNLQIIFAAFLKIVWPYGVLAAVVTAIILLIWEWRHPMDDPYDVLLSGSTTLPEKTIKLKD